MKKAIVSFGFDRPEMMEQSFRSIMSCPEYINYNWHCFIDGQGKAQRSFYQEDYPDIRFTIREQRVGLNANILMAFKELFEFYKYDYILYVEDDVLVSNDFIKFMEHCREGKQADVFTIGAFSRMSGLTEDDRDKAKLFNWYHPWGVLIDTNDYALLQEHIVEYVGHPVKYLNDRLQSVILERCPDYHAREYRDGKCINITQDCLLNAVRAINSKYQLIPLWSRSQNIGFYGTHQAGEYDGEDLSSESVHMMSMHATNNFKPPYRWEKIELIPGIES